MTERQLGDSAEYESVADVRIRKGAVEPEALVDLLFVRERAAAIVEGLGDPQIRRTRNIGIRRLVTEIRALEAQAQIAGQYRGEDAGVAKCRAVSVGNPRPSRRF